MLPSTMTATSPGEKLKSAREAAGLTVRQAARLSGIHHNSAYDIEKGDDGVTLRLMRKYADAIGVSLGEIFGADDERPERVPAELRPLLEPLAPLTRPVRESIVRNIAANLRFMGMMYGTQESSRMSVPSDKLEEIPEAAPQGASSVSGSEIRGRTEKMRRRHGKPETKGKTG